MIISLVNQKGGVGKTTVAINLSYCIANKKGQKVLLIDADLQASCLHWQAIADDSSFDIIQHTDADFHKAIDEMVKGYKWVVIDCPPGVGDVSISALMVSNFAIVPVSPSLLDMFSTRETVSLIREARQYNKKLKGKLLINKKVSGTVPAREAREALGPYKIGIFETEIGHRIDFVRSMTAGVPIMSYAPNSQASKEIENLCNEIG